MTSQGQARTVFCRALEHGNLLVAEATAKELPPLNLTDALELTILIAQKVRAASARCRALAAALPRGMRGGAPSDTRRGPGGAVIAAEVASTKVDRGS
jgi:hypothetical protein